MTARGAFTEGTRRVIQDRDDWRCFIDGGHALAHQIQHRRARGMGGSRRPSTAHSANGILLHPHCHDYVEMHPQEAAKHGWRIRQEDEPWDVPVLRWDGWVILAESGAVHYLPMQF